jgi:hypothetical protein
MAVKQAKTKAVSTRSAATRATRKKSGGSQTDKKRSSPGVVSTAKKVGRAVIAGAASEAVQGAVEAGKDATGLGKKGTQARPPQRS